MSETDRGRRPAREWPIPPMDHGSGDKRSAFTWAMGHLILQRIADGETMKAITADPRMPAYATVYRWIEVHAAFGRAYRQVRNTVVRLRLEERDARQRPRRRSGRKTTYTVERGEAVCAAISDGASLSEVVRRPGMPSFKAIYRWLRYEPEFRARFIDACDLRSLQLETEALETVNGMTLETAPLDMRRVKQLEGRIGRLRPKLYRVR